MNKQTLKQYLWIAAIVLSVIFLSITYFFFLYRNQSINEGIEQFFDILNPLVLGAVFAYIMKSTCNFYEKKLLRVSLKSGKRSRAKVKKTVNWVAVVLTYITWIATISLLLLIAVPQIIQSVTKFVNEMIVKIPEYLEQLSVWEQNFLKDNEALRPYFDKAFEFLANWTVADLLPLLQNFVSSDLLPTIIKLFGSIMDIVIGLVISFFILLSRKTLAKRSFLFLHCIFKKDKAVNAIVDEFKYADKMFGGFLEGKVIDSAIIGTIYYIVLEIISVPYAPLVAVICGVTNIIPIFGPFIGAIPSAFIILTSDPFKVIPFVIFVFIIQFIDGYIIDPHIVGGNIKMSSFWVIFAVILFGGLWDFVGLLIGVPTFAVIYDIVKKVAIYVLKKRGKAALLEKHCGSGEKKVAVAVGAPTAQETVATNDDAASTDGDTATEEMDSSEKEDPTSENTKQ